MAKSVEQRQREYRARRTEGEGVHRLNTWIATGANLALERLSRSYGVTKRAMIERLVVDADDAVLKTLELDTAEWDQYFAVTA